MQVVRSIVLSCVMVAGALCGVAIASAQQAPQLSATTPAGKHRLFVLTDMEADPDDAQSMVRLMLYANDIDIEGLAATTSTHLRTRVAPESIRQIIEAYGKVHANLLLHDRSYPTADALSGRVTRGPALYGMLGVGEGHDSPASDRLIEALERNDPRPLWVSVWGGPNVLAQALWKIRATKTAAEAERLFSKVRVYTISDQDDSGPWIRQNFPTVSYIVSPAGYGPAAWTGIRDVIANAPEAINAGRQHSWLAANIQQGHGPLGAMYPDISYGMEGDTPSFLGLVPNGLNNMNHPNWGGWGGRYELYLPEPPAPQPGGNPNARPPQPETRPIWTNVADTYRRPRPRPFDRSVDTTSFTGNQVTVWRWREEFQNDFAARMDWTIMGVEEANHPPVPGLATPDTFTVKAGQTFSLDASGTYDPDGDSMSYYWFQYAEVGTYEGTVGFGSLAPNLYNVHTVVAPQVTSPKTAHFILMVTDKGSPALTRYRRVIVTFVP